MSSILNGLLRLSSIAMAAFLTNAFSSTLRGALPSMPTSSHMQRSTNSQISICTFQFYFMRERASHILSSLISAGSS